MERAYPVPAQFGKTGALGRRHCMRLGLGLACASLLAACAGAPKPVVTPVQLRLLADAGVNPDSNGRPSPIMVRVYALKSDAKFASADYFALFDDDTATLGSDLVKREEMVLQPGQVERIEMTLDADVRLIGIIAGYRDLAHATWRQKVALTPGEGTALLATLGARQISIQAR